MASTALRMTFARDLACRSQKHGHSCGHQPRACSHALSGAKGRGTDAQAPARTLTNKQQAMAGEACKGP
eukprot:498512-Alexandrium_andersonii.AAC.1